MKTILIFLLKFALTGLCLWWAFSQVDLDHLIFTNPQDLKFLWLLGGISLAGVSILLQSLRFWFFLRAQNLTVSLLRSIELTLIDSLFSLASFSGLGGDAARMILLMREHPNRKLVISMAVMADHLAGMVSLAILFFLVSATRFEALAAPSALGKGVIQFAWFYLGGGLAMVILIFILASPPVHRRIHANGRFSRWSLMKRIPEVCDVYRKNWKHAIAGLAASFLMLIVYFSSYFCGLRAVGGTSSYGDVISAMPVIDAISGLPISVAGVGVREKLFEVLMKDLAEVKPETAVAASLAGFSCNALWALVGAFLFLKKRERLTVAELKQVRTKLIK